MQQAMQQSQQMASTGKMMLEMIRYRLAIMTWGLRLGVNSHSRLGPHLDRGTAEPDEVSLITHSFSLAAKGLSEPFLLFGVCGSL